MRTAQTRNFEEWLWKKNPEVDLNFTYNDPKVQLAWESWSECLKQETEYYNNKDKPHGPVWGDTIKLPEVCHVTGINEVYSGKPPSLNHSHIFISGDPSDPACWVPNSGPFNKGPIVGSFPAFKKTDDSGWRLTGSMDY